MGINKFLDDKDEIVATKKDYKSKVNKELKTKFEEDSIGNNSFNLLDMKKEDKPKKKVPMSIYFEEEDLKLLKAISKFKNTTVNKTVMSILQDPLSVTKNNLPEEFNIEKLSKEYDKNSRNKKGKIK